MIDEVKLRAKKLELNIAQQTIEQLTLTVTASGDNVARLSADLEQAREQIALLNTNVDTLNASNIALLETNASLQQSASEQQSRITALVDINEGLEHMLKRRMIIAAYIVKRVQQAKGRFTVPQPTRYNGKLNKRHCVVSLLESTVTEIIDHLDSLYACHDNHELAGLLA